MFRIIFFNLLFVMVFFLMFWLFKTIRKGYQLSRYRLVKFKRGLQTRWQKWKLKKNAPDFVKKGLQRYDEIIALTANLPRNWQKILQVLLQLSKDIIKHSAHKPKRARVIRNFYVLTLSSLKNFVEALQEHDNLISPAEKIKAIQNIDVLKLDLLQYQQQLQQKRRFDFDVIMEVIKQRTRRK